jgi:ATP-dependent Lon protease
MKFPSGYKLEISPVSLILSCMLDQLMSTHYGEFISVTDSEQSQDSAIAENKLPVLPLRDVVVYPHMVIPLFVGREKSIDALDAAMSMDKRIMLAAQTSASVDDPTENDIHRVGTIATILQLLKLPDGTIKVLVEGVQRAVIDSVEIAEDGYFVADFSFPESVQEDEEVDTDRKELDVLVRSVTNMFDQYVKMNKKVPPEILSSLTGIDDADRLGDMIAAQMSLRV